MMNVTLNKWAKLALSFLLCLCIEVTGAWFTRRSNWTWYSLLYKPPSTPPNEVFSIVWTIIYLLMAISLWLIWIKIVKPYTLSDIATWFFFWIQLFLNFLWPYLFFYLQNPVLAFLDIILLWTTIFITIGCFWNYSKLAAFLLIPYLLWVTYAVYLNFWIWAYNPTLI